MAPARTRRGGARSVQRTGADPGERGSLGDDITRYRAVGDHSAANATERERDTLRRRLAEIALAFHIHTEIAERAPATARGQIGVPATELVDLLAAIGEALDTRSPDVIEWTASVRGAATGRAAA